MVQKRTIQKVLKAGARLREHGYDVDRLILFGSRARDHQRKDSDIDLCVVARKLKDRWDERLKMQLLVRDIDIQFDIFPCSPREYRYNRLSPMIDQIRKTGVEVT